MYFNKYLKYKKKYINSKLIKKGGSFNLRHDLIEKTNTLIYNVNLDNTTVQNTDYRKVLATSNNMQLVVMSIPKHENINFEIHKDHDQFIKVEKGSCTAIIGDNSNKKSYILNEGDCIIIPLNTYHEIINTGNESLKLYTIYTPPEHDVNRIDHVKPIIND
jgi:mannose-6-phosphate isomerase-like protein (cupin superfamily)